MTRPPPRPPLFPSTPLSRSGPAGVARVEDWRKTDLKQDYIVVATPLGITDAILRDLALRRPAGVIFDVGSLKSPLRAGDRKSTRLNSSHSQISYAVFCLKKK